MAQHKLRGIQWPEVGQWNERMGGGVGVCLAMVREFCLIYLDVYDVRSIWANKVSHKQRVM